MKISYSNWISSPKAAPLLSLVPKEEPENKKNIFQHTLRSVPTDAKSAKYKITANVLQGDEAARTVLKWHKVCNKIIKGLGIADYSSALAIVETLVHRTPQATLYARLRTAQQVQIENHMLTAYNTAFAAAEATTAGTGAAAGTAASTVIYNLGTDHSDNCEYK